MTEPAPHAVAHHDADRTVVLMPVALPPGGAGRVQRIVSVAMPLALVVMNLGLAVFLVLTRTGDASSILAALALVGGAYVAARLAWVAWSFRAGRASMIDARVKAGVLSIGVFQGVFRLRRWLTVDKGSTITVRCAPAEPPHSLSVTTSGGHASVGSTVAWSPESHAELSALAKPFGVKVRRES